MDFTGFVLRITGEVLCRLGGLVRGDEPPPGGPLELHVHVHHHGPTPRAGWLGRRSDND